MFRFIAALIVVIHHYGREATGWTGISTAGPQMVTFFFVLSGFVMVLAYGGATELSARRYWRARAVRILPAYYLALIGSVVLLMLLRRPVDGAAFGLSATLLQAWSPAHAMQLNTPAWSLSVEAFFYLLFPLLLPLSRRGSFWQRLALLMVFWLLTQLALTVLLNADIEGGSRAVWNIHFALYHPLSHLCSFLLGMAAGGAYRALVNRPQTWAEQGLMWLLSIALVTLVGSETRIPTPFGLPLPAELLLPFGASFWSPLFALWILLFARVPAAIARRFSHPAALHLGEISFALYILQAPLHRLWVSVSWLGQTTSVLQLLLYMAALILLADLCHRLMEKPLQRWLSQQIFSATWPARRHRVADP